MKAKSKEKAKAFYITDKQDKLIRDHKKQNRISTSKQIRLMINFVFSDEERLKDFNQYIAVAKEI